MLLPKLVLRRSMTNSTAVVSSYKLPCIFSNSTKTSRSRNSFTPFNITFRKIRPVNNLLFSTYSQPTTMSYFVIGVSGVTSGGKTTMSKLIQKSFPHQSRVIHQDKYFYPDDYEGHIRLPEVENHVNYDCDQALNMKQMHQDVFAILDASPEIAIGNGHAKNGDVIPNFGEGQDFISTIKDIGIDTSDYASIPILIIEGFTMFASDFLYNKCDVRFFLTLDEDTCRQRRSKRNFDPPDCPGYFEHCIWPEYQNHYKEYIEDRQGIMIHSGKAPVHNIWKESVELILKKLEKKYPKLQNNVKTR